MFFRDSFRTKLARKQQIYVESWCWSELNYRFCASGVFGLKHLTTMNLSLESTWVWRIGPCLLLKTVA